MLRLSICARIQNESIQATGFPESDVACDSVYTHCSWRIIITPFQFRVAAQLPSKLENGADDIVKASAHAWCRTRIYDPLINSHGRPLSLMTGKLCIATSWAFPAVLQAVVCRCVFWHEKAVSGDQCGQLPHWFSEQPVHDHERPLSHHRMSGGADGLVVMIRISLVEVRSTKTVPLLATWGRVRSASRFVSLPGTSPERLIFLEGLRPSLIPGPLKAVLSPNTFVICPVGEQSEVFV